MTVRSARKPMEGPRSEVRGGVYAIVLAAGRSSRMGEPKPLVRLAGKPLLVHVLDALRASAVSGIVVVLGEEADRVRRQISLNVTRVVVNPDYREGMSSSIRAGLRAAPEAEGILIVLGDQPLVTPATFGALLERWTSTRARILVPTYSGVRGNPVLFGSSLFTEIESVAGDAGCREIVVAHASEVVEVPVDDPGILIDVDTPEDLHRVEAVLRGGSEIARLAADRIAEGA